MRAFSSFIISSLIHVSLALTAFQYVGPLQNIEPEVYTLDLILDKENHITQKETPPLIQTERKKVATKKVQTKKQNTKNLITQKQPSPIQIKNDPAIPIAKKIETVSQEPEGDSDKQTLTKASSLLSSDSLNPKDARLLLQKTGNRPPEYPLRDRLHKNTGRVVALGFVNKDGIIDKVKVLESNGTKDMEQNVVLAFKNYRFEENQEGWVKMPYEFILEGESKILSTRQRNFYEHIRQ